MSSSLSHSTETPEEPFSRGQLEHPCRLQLTWAREDCSSPPTSPGDARGALGRDSPQKKPDLGLSRTKNNLPAAQEERRAKHIQIIHMSGGESSASIFRDNRGEHGVWCNSVWNSGTAALKSLQAFLGQQSSRRSIPPGSCPPSGDELPCLVPGSDREPQCSCAKEKRPPAQPLLSSPKRQQQQQPGQLGAQRTWKLLLGRRVFSHLQSLQQQSLRNPLPA